MVNIYLKAALEHLGGFFVSSQWVAWQHRRIQLSPSVQPHGSPGLLVPRRPQDCYPGLLGDLLKCHVLMRPLLTIPEIPPPYSLYPCSCIILSPHPDMSLLRNYFAYCPQHTHRERKAYRFGFVSTSIPRSQHSDWYALDVC